MKTAPTTELVMIRHAPIAGAPRLCGRTDAAADCSDARRIASVARSVGTPDSLISSPASRCRATHAALWPEISRVRLDADLWEQDFGDWEGQPHARLPDIGLLDAPAIAAHRPPGGESFSDLCARAVPSLQKAAADGGKIVVVAHAGVVRAALAHALGAPHLALAFDVAPLSVTRFRPLPGGSWAIASVNWTAE